MTLCQKLHVQEGTARRSESMQQSSATPKNQDLGIGLWKIVACSPRSALLYVQFLHPTSLPPARMRSEGGSVCLLLN